MALPPTLRLALAVAVAAERRCKPGALQGLRMIWEHAEDDATAERCARQITIGLSPSQRHWLGTLGGDRKPTAV
jgi:hypothetical protein